jgi:hypothetical protein
MNSFRQTATEPTAEAHRGRHSGSPCFNVLAGGPGNLAERSATEAVAQGQFLGHAVVCFPLLRTASRAHKLSFEVSDEGMGT